MRMNPVSFGSQVRLLPPTDIRDPHIIDKQEAEHLERAIGRLQNNGNNDVVYIRRRNGEWEGNSPTYDIKVLEKNQSGYLFSGGSMTSDWGYIDAAYKDAKNRMLPVSERRLINYYL